MTVAIGLGSLFLMLAIGTPVGFAMLISGVIGLYLVGGMGMVAGILQTAPLSTVSAYELITIPMFLLMAEFVLASGVADDLFKATAAWVGRIRGGLGMATALAGAGFGAICGSSTASAATLSSTSLPAMLKQGYEPRLAAGVVAISGTLAMLIPPSIALVVYGLLAEVNIGGLLIGGIIPGIIVTFAIMATVWFLAWQDPSRAPAGETVPWAVKIAHLKVVGPTLLLFGMVTGVIYTGIATPTEASALGALGGFGLALWYGKLNRLTMRRALLRACHGTCMIAMILLGAHVFGYFFTLTQVTQNLVAFVGGLEVPRWVIMTLILGGYIILGMFMDQIAILVLTVPIVLPLIKSLGYDPLWFGVIKIVTAEVGMITPPIGLNCFIVSRYSGRPVAEVFHGTFPHFVAHLLVIALFVIFPELILWLPSRMMPG
jgi:tripartite ATP-independent transporter DctM subunit